MKIYTKTGDGGKTGLLDGKRYSKSHKTFEVLGTLDELNACLGFLSLSKDTEVKNIVRSVQSQLFSLGALLANPKSTGGQYFQWEDATGKIEKLIDRLDTKNRPLRNFILPGGCVESCYLHLARTMCRRLERLAVSALRAKRYAKMLKYVNRLSDLLFVLARYANTKKKISDIIWKSL